MNVKKTVFYFLFISFFSNCFIVARSQETQLSIDTIQNYKNWGWEAIILKNEYISVAIVPSMGGNILQYDFGIDTLLMLNSNTFGQTYQIGSGNSPFNSDWGFGGHQTWPTPETWPPPPNLTYRAYTFSIESINSDSITVILKSEKETEIFPGIQMERKITVYKNSTRVKVENSIINTTANILTNGIMNVSYVGSDHLSSNNYDNYIINFPVNPNSKYGKEGVYFDPKSTSFMGEINPGIYTIEYKPRQGKLFADVKDGWASYVDKRDSQAYLRIFEVFEGETYPDNGARFEVYVSVSPPFMAMEVMSPLKELPANGGRYTFVDNFCSAKLNYPIFKANQTGAVMERLTYDSIQGTISGKFGVFNEGELQLNYYNKNRDLIVEGKRFSVNPGKTFSLIENISLPKNTNTIEIQAYNTYNELIGILDFIDLTKTEIVNIHRYENEECEFIVQKSILKNYEILNCQVNNLFCSPISIELLDSSGKKISTIFKGYKPEGFYNIQYQLKNIVPGLYLVVFKSDKKSVSSKIIVTNN